MENTAIKISLSKKKKAHCVDDVNKMNSHDYMNWCSQVLVFVQRTTLLDLFVYDEIPFVVIKRIDLLEITRYQGLKRYVQHRCLNQSKFLYSTQTQRTASMQNEDECETVQSKLFMCRRKPKLR